MKVAARFEQSARASFYMRLLLSHHGKTAKIDRLFTLNFPFTETSRIAFSHSLVTTTRKIGAQEKSMAKKAPNPIDKHVGSRVRMRRMMLSMSQEKLGDALGLTFQQVQKYEKGTNRIGASRLQQIAHILQVPVSFFFEGAPHSAGHGGMSEAPSPAYVADFLATSDGLSLTKAFMRIKSSKLRRRIVDLVEQIAGID
jgi:transcriptional regulator with XRE-family HTH domain